MDSEQVEYVHHSELHHHPRNMRRVYPQRDVEQMAESIRARGVIQPLIAIQDNGRITVVAGNLRLRGARWLGDDAPLLPVIVRERGEAEQLLDMAAENLVRADVDVVSEALHYRTLIEEEGIGKMAIAREVGVSLFRVNERLLMLELNPEIQQLMAEEQLPHGTPVIKAFLGIPDDDVRVEAAGALARKHAPVQIIRSTCTRIRQALERKIAVEEAGRACEEYVPATEAVFVEDMPPNGKTVVRWQDIQEAARVPCSDCDAYDYELDEKPDRNRAWEVFVEKGELAADETDEPVWEEIETAAEGTCVACGLRDDRELCGRCPMVEFMQRLVRQVARRDK